MRDWPYFSSSDFRALGRCTAGTAGDAVGLEVHLVLADALPQRWFLMHGHLLSKDGGSSTLSVPTG
jgi:hypothetical protein